MPGENIVDGEEVGRLNYDENKAGVELAAAEERTKRARCLPSAPT